MHHLHTHHGRACSDPAFVLPTGANISQHLLEGFDLEEVLPNKGQLQEVGASTARLAGGRLSGTFSVVLPPAAASNLQAVDVLHAGGPMDGDTILVRLPPKRASRC